MGIGPDVVLPAGAGDRAFGASLTPAGDTNADGFDDLYVGAPDPDGGGAAYVFLGGVGGAEPERVVALEASEGTGLGGDAVGIDLDGDGHADLAAACETRLCIHLGGADGAEALPSVALDVYDGAWIGGVAAGHTLDADGLPDLVAWVDGDRLVPLYGSGSAPPRVGDALTGAADHELVALADATDLDGDGLADVVSLWEGPRGETLLVHDGAEHGPAGDSTSARTRAEDEPSMVDVATGGDVDGDGHPDLLVRVYPDSGSGIDVYRGGVALTDGPAWTSPSPTAHAAAQWASVAVVGQTDGDRYADVFATAMSLDTDGSWLVRLPGGPEGPAEAADSTLGSLSGSEGWFTKAHAAGDVDGDCLADAAVRVEGPGALGDPAEVWLYLGEGPGACPPPSDGCGCAAAPPAPTWVALLLVLTCIRLRAARRRTARPTSREAGRDRTRP